MESEKERRWFLKAMAGILIGIMASSSVLASGIDKDVHKKDVPITVILNHTSTEADMVFSHKPFLKNGEVYLPIREFLNEAATFPTQVLWKPSQEIVLKSKYTDLYDQTVETSAKMTIGHSICEITKGNDKAQVFSLNSEPILVKGITYVPRSLLMMLNREISLTNGCLIMVGEQEDVKEKISLANMWAEALITRNGKPRYDKMTSKMQLSFIEKQKELIGDDDNWNYVIGVSSPWTISYDILLTDEADITYYQTDSVNERYEMREVIQWEKQNDEWRISGCHEK